ncbi:MAG TPA: polysaccharide biosynthesis/export family protein [Rhizomicrobium sp.]|nr:polysaccharide biosynthesis/export family protein [Rhizomicrobium sp.]
MSRLSAFFAALALVATASAAAAQDVSSTYRLGTGDKVRVIVYGEDDLGGTFEVDGNGMISLPLIGQVKATGESAPQLEAAIMSALADGYLNNPRVNVEVTDYRPFYVLGEVNRPGQYAYVNGMSVFNAVALAGGYTGRAIESSVCIRRSGETEEQCVDTDETTKIHPGDIVRVPLSPFWAAMSVISPLTGLAYLKGAL